MTEPGAELTRAVHAALRTYSNVHRGSGHCSLVSTRLYEQAREIVLEHLGLDPRRFVVVFCTPRRADALGSRLATGSYRTASSAELGLPLGVVAVAVLRKALPRGVPLETGGGTARLVAPGWVVWARGEERFEAGTPAIVNVIAFARALGLVRQHGSDAFRAASPAPLRAETIVRRDALLGLSGRELLSALRASVIGLDLRVPTSEGERRYVNLDNAASTRTLAPVFEAFCQTLTEQSPVQQDVVREVRAVCAEVLGAPAERYDVLFTSNTTEAINVAAEGLQHGSEPGQQPVVLDTLLEHNSNELPWRRVPGLSLARLGVDTEGFLDLEELESTLRAFNAEGRHGRRRIRLLAVSGASNVLGSCNDLASISRLAHRYGARVLVDAAQLVAHRTIDVDSCGIDALAFSAHKLYAPFGSGVLLLRKGLLAGNAEQLARIRASGEENAAGIAALGKALVLLQRVGLEVVRQEEQALTARALRGLAGVDGLTVYGVKDPDSPRFTRRGGVIAFSVKGMMPDRVARVLAERGGIGVRWGCHCAHLLVKRLLGIPPLLERFQRLIVSVFPRLNLPGVARVSLGIENTEEDVDRLISVLRGLRDKPRDRRVVKQIDELARDAARSVYAPEAGPAA